jgi:hypothetical protein
VTKRLAGWVDGRGRGAAAAVLVFVAVWSVARPAEAHPPTSCADVGDYHVKATNGTQTGNHQAVKSVMLFGHIDNDCSRISSLNVVSGVNGVVEWGWALGWLFGADETGPCGMTSAYHTDPVLFAFWRPINGVSHCTVETEVGSADYNMALKDPNSDTTWQYNFAQGPIEGNMNVNFDRGKIWTNAERIRIAADTNHAHFDQLQWQVAGQTTWFNFVDLDPDPLSDDPTFHCIMASQTNEKVEANPQTCVD